MKTILLISPILLALLRTVFSKDDYQVYYIDNACPTKDASVTYSLAENHGRETAAIVKATKKWKSLETNCSISFSTKNPSTKILFSVRKIDFDYTDCNRYFINVTEGIHNKSLVKLCDRISDSQESKSYISKEREIKFHIFTAHKIFFQVELIVTAYSEVSTSIFHFKCNNDKYISSALTCDDHNNCGDRSDEMNCPIFTPGIIAAIVIGCLLLIAGIGFAIWFFFVRRSTFISTYTHRVYT